jgi:hypothetical protein
MFFKIENYNLLENLISVKNKYFNILENIKIKNSEILKNKKFDSHSLSKISFFIKNFKKKINKESIKKNLKLFRKKFSPPLKERNLNFFSYFKNINTKNQNQTDKILIKNKLLDEILIENCEILPKNFLFSCVNSFLKIESIELKENLRTKIISYLNLWYQKKEFAFSKIKFDSIKVIKNEKKIILNAFEPRIKNILFIFDSLSKKTNKFFLQKKISFKPGENFKFDDKLFNKLMEAKIFSNINFSIENLETLKNLEFINLCINLNEYSSFSYKPEIYFDGKKFNGSIFVENKNFLGCGINLIQKIDITPNIQNKEIKNYLFFLELSNFPNQLKKIILQSQKISNQEWSNGLNLEFFKKKKGNASLKIHNFLKNYQKKYFFLNQIQFENLIEYSFNNLCNFNLRSNLIFENFYSELKNFGISLKIKNLFKIPLLKNIFSIEEIENQISIGFENGVSVNSMEEFPGIQILKYSKIYRPVKQMFLHRSSLSAGKNFFKERVFCGVFFNAFSIINKNKNLNNFLFGIKINFNNLANFYIWKTSEKKTGIYFFF